MMGLVTFTAVVTSGCVVLFSIALARDPQSDLVRRGIGCVPDSTQPKSLQVLDTHRWSNGVVVLYTGLCPSQNRRSPLQRVLGHKVIKRSGIHWKISGSDSYGTEKRLQPSEEFITYGISKGLNRRNDRYTIVYGQVLKPKVAAIEVTFDNGRVLRGAGNNGVFALISPGATGVCELRVLGTDNQILQQKDLATPQRFALGKQAHQCLPVSRQL
jgi:hypothetical protein